MVNEHQLAKLRCTLDAKYSPFGTSLGMLASVFSQVTVVDGPHASDYFFPMPLLGGPYSYKSYPLNRLDMTTMYMVRIRFAFDDAQVTLDDGYGRSYRVSSKRLISLFAKQLFARPDQQVRDVLAKMCKNVNEMCDASSISPYTKIRRLTAPQFLFLYNLLTNPQHAHNSLMHHLLDMPDVMQNTTPPSPATQTTTTTTTKTTMATKTKTFAVQSTHKDSPPTAIAFKKQALKEKKLKRKKQLVSLKHSNKQLSGRLNV